jgi:DNA-binding CsgD family transcriptional regulator
MSQLPSDAPQVIDAISQIAASSDSLPQRCAAVADALRQVVPFDAAWIGILDHERREHLPLLNDGYDRKLTALFQSPTTIGELERLGLDRTRTPMRAQDIPLPLSERRVWAEYLLPAGFREGLTAGLFTTDGRYLGNLTLNTTTAAHPTRAAADLIGMLTPLIARAVDPWRSITAVSHLVRDATAGVVLCRDGRTLPLPGLPGHRLLAAGSPLLQVAAAHPANGVVHASMMCRDDGAPAGYHTVTVLACPAHPHHDVLGVVTLSPPRDLRGLTARELEVLGMTTQGWSNQQIAAALGITPRTAAAHIEHIMAKLSAPNRTAAAVRASQLGLYLPPPPHRG